MVYADYQLEQAWKEFGDIPISDNEEETLDSDADLSYGIHFDKGTPKEDVWHFFDENHSKGVAWLLYEFGLEDEMQIEFDESLMHSDNVLANELVGSFEDTNENGTDKYLYSTRIGTINSDSPVYYDVWLRYNKEQGFIDVYGADEENKCYSPDYPDNYFPVPEHIVKKMEELVLKHFTWFKKLDIKDWHKDDNGSFKKSQAKRDVSKGYIRETERE